MAQATPKGQRTYDYGVKTWCSPAEPTVDICFIHGLTGHRDKTWTAAGAQEPWPVTLLAAKFPHARLLTFGYDADIVRFGVAAQDTIKTLADNLLYSLRDDRDEVGAAHRPLVFIVHSLGGIVCKKAVARSQHSSDETLARLAASLIGIVFMGTPHDGSSLADAAGPLVSSLGWFKSTNKALRKILKRDNQTAADIDNEFWEAWKVIETTSTEQIKIFCFFEILPLPAIKKRVVPEKSAVYQHHPSQKIDADHHSMVKFQSADDPGFKRLCGVLRDFLSSKRTGLLLSPGGGPPPGGGAPPSSRGPPQDPSQSHPPRHPQHEPSSGPGSRGDAPPASAPPGPLNGSSPSQRCYHFPFHKNHNFVGRKDVLQKLRALLFEDAHTVVALYGLGGVGKTQVANALVHWAKEHTDRSVYWVPALSKSGFEEAYAAIAAKLGIQRKDKQDIRILVRDYLSSDAAGPWFFVLDNADDPELVCSRTVPDSLAQYLPKSDHGRTLVTTRTQTVARAVAQKTMPLGAFDLPQARQLATTLLDNPDLLGDDVSSADALFSELECLPLALTQAMAYMDQTSVSAEEYLQMLRGTEKDKIDLLGNEFSDSTRYRESRNAVTATWLVSFGHLQNTHPDSVALLEFLSQIQPKAIPIAMLPEPKSGSSASLLNAVSALCAYGFVSKQKDMLDMHSLVHMATRSWVENGRLETVKGEALRHVAFFVWDFNPQYNTWRPFFPHVLFLLHGAEGVSVSSMDEYTLCNWAGYCYLEDGNFEKCMQCSELCARWADASLEKDHPEQLQAHYALGVAFGRNDRLPDAIRLLEHVVRACTERPLPDTVKLLMVAQHQLATFYEINGQTQKAIELLENAVRVQETTLAVDDYGASQRALAGLYNRTGRHLEALQILERIVSLTSVLAEVHVERLAVEYELANAYNATGQAQKAIQLLEHVVSVETKFLPQTNRERLISEFGLGQLYLEHGQATQAVHLLEHVARARNETLAETHPDRLDSEFELALAYIATGQAPRAVDLLEQVVRMNKVRYFEDVPWQLYVQKSLAGALWESGQKKKAFELMRHIVERWMNGRTTPTVSMREKTWKRWRRKSVNLDDLMK